MSKQLSILICSLLVAIYFIIGVYWYDIWLGWTIFCLLITLLLFVSIRDHVQSSWHGWIMIGWSIGIALSHSIYTQWHFILLNLLITIPLLLYWVFILRYGDRSIWDWIVNFVSNFDRLFLTSEPYDVVSNIFTKKSHRLFNIQPNIWWGIIGWMVLLLILVPLLSAADPVFESFFSSIGSSLSEIFSNLAEHISFAKIIVAILITWILWSVAIKLIEKSKENIIWPSLGIDLHSTIYTIMIWFVWFIYIIFTIIQIKYLFLWWQLPDGLTYSQYAVKWFWQLIVVSFINIALMLSATHHKKTWISVNKRYHIVVSIVFSCSIIIWYSSFVRLNLYIDTYWLTFMRVLPWSFLIYLIYGLVVSYGGIYLSKWPRYNLLAYGVIVWYSCFQLVWVDRIIANYNIKHYITWATTILDTEYLSKGLSLDQRLWSYTVVELEQYLNNQKWVTTSQVSVADLKPLPRQEQSLSYYLISRK